MDNHPVHKDAIAKVRPRAAILKNGVKAQHLNLKGLSQARSVGGDLYATWLDEKTVVAFKHCGQRLPLSAGIADAHITEAQRRRFEDLYVSGRMIRTYDCDASDKDVEPKIDADLPLNPLSVRASKFQLDAHAKTTDARAQPHDGSRLVQGRRLNWLVLAANPRKDCWQDYK
jgi:hypothetical protein